MVRSTDGYSSVAPFLKKCYEMVDDASTNSIISWSQNNGSFIIWDMTEFSVQLLPKYFKHSNSSSFIRQLNIYGFRKVDTDSWEFANDGFVRDQKQLLKNICRRKNSQGADNGKSLQQQECTVEPHDRAENTGLWNEVENLKTDKTALMQELVKLREHQETAENKLLLLKERMHGMEKSQQQMLSFLVMAMQSPGFLVQLLHPKESNRLMSEPEATEKRVKSNTQSLASDGMIVKYQPPPMNEMANPVHPALVCSENPQESNASSDGLTDLFLNSDFMKVLMDENLSSFENHPPFVLPDLMDDGTLENFLLSGPFLESVKDAKQDSKEPADADADAENEKGTVFASQFDRSETFELIGHNKIPQDSEIESTEKSIMEILAMQLDLL